MATIKINLRGDIRTGEPAGDMGTGKGTGRRCTVPRGRVMGSEVKVTVVVVPIMGMSMEIILMAIIQVNIYNNIIGHIYLIVRYVALSLNC